MKTLWIMRHAKAHEQQPDEKDHERALKRRGQDDAQAMGERLLDLGARPEVVVSSTARRAVQTAEIVGRILGVKQPIRKRRDLYLAGPSEIVLGLREAMLEDPLPDDEPLEGALLVGHNPGLEELLLHFSEGRHADLPTAGLAQVSLDVATLGQVTLDTPSSVNWVWRPSDRH